MMLISNVDTSTLLNVHDANGDFRATQPGASQAYGLPQPAPLDDDAIDWSEALNAVPTRLRQIVGQRLATDSGLPISDARARIQIDVLECATAMDLLNEALLAELRRCHQLEHEALSTPHALAHQRADPAERPAGGRDVRQLVPRERQTPMAQRRLFRQRLDRALATEGSAVSLLVIDLEGLRPITEIHGPDVGDHVLQIIAARLSRTVRAGDVLSRMGFQEFGCLPSGPIDRAQLGIVAGKMLDATSAPLRVGNLWLQVNPSIGIADGVAGVSGAAGMLLGASGAMLQARQRRSGYAFFDPPSRRPNPRVAAANRTSAPWGERAP